MKGLISDIILFFVITLSFIFTFDKINSKIVSSDISYRLSISDVNSDRESDISISSSTVVSSIEPDNTKSQSYFSPKTQRSPFLSPMDYKKLRDMEEQKKKADEVLNSLISKKSVVSIKSVYDKYRLQGIVGKYAIINGDMVMEGQIYKKELEVIKILNRYIIVKYKGKVFKLTIK